MEKHQGHYRTDTVVVYLKDKVRFSFASGQPPGAMIFASFEFSEHKRDCKHFYKNVPRYL